jgi:inhibitor of KinA sporulation pathway (predicted exonuclease)
MARLLDQVLVIDIESTCWEGAPPVGEVSEIIEIGLCPVEVASGRRLEKRSILVRPVRSKVSAFCEQLTTLTQQQVDAGMDFADACRLLERDYRSPDRLWASYGDYDRNQFTRQCQSANLRYPFGPSHLNIKTLFALAHRLPAEVGLDAAMRLLGITMTGTHHRGDDDAWNAALVLIKLLERLRPPPLGPA